MGPLRYLAGSLVFMAALLASMSSEAAFHQWRFAEIYSSADGTVQFIELVNPTIATGETVSGTAEFRTNSGNVYDFPANLSGNTANKSLLIATDNFELIPGAVTPQFNTLLPLPANFFDPAGDTIRLFQPSFGEFASVTFTAVPTDNVFARQFRPSVADVANSPKNFAGNVGSINRGDYNSDGIIDAADYPVWRKSFSETVSPAGKGADGDTDGTIDDGDYTLWSTLFGNTIVGAGLGSGGSVIAPEPATLSLALVVWAILIPRRRLHS